jgi:dTDP-4-amino-4,6-dideoxygalactose transaminase
MARPSSEQMTDTDRAAEEPVTTARVPLADVLVDEEVLAAVREAVASGWWSMGPRVAEFEDAFAAFIGTRNAIAVSSGTAALHLALLAAGCGPGDEVVLPSLNFVAAANVVLHTGARPVFCDIGGRLDLNLAPADVERAIGPATKAIVVLHFGGFPCDIATVQAIASRHGLAVIEDSAHAPGARALGKMCGTIGDLGCFSFFANKNMPVGEGGMLVTDDDGLAERVRLLRSHGMTSLTWDRHRGHAHSYDVVEPGFNYRLDEVRAAIGLIELGRLPAENAARARVVARYRQALHGVRGLAMPFPEANPDSSAHHLAVLLLPEGADRKRIQVGLTAAGIQTSVHYPPIHRFSWYAARTAADAPLPETDAVAGQLLTLPLFGHMTDGQVESVVDAVLAEV